MNNRIFQIYYDEKSKLKVNLESDFLYNKDLTVFFENLVISEWFRVNYQQLDRIDYIGFLSYNFEDKNDMLIPFESFKKGDYDIYTLGKTVFNHNVVLFGKTSHGKYFDILFKQMCESVFNLSALQLDEINLGVYQNAVVCKTYIYKQYVENYLNPCIDWLVKYPYKDMLFSECKYNGKMSERELLLKTGFPYYTFHTFLLERLWSVFIHLNKDIYKVKI